MKTRIGIATTVLALLSTAALAAWPVSGPRSLPSRNAATATLDDVPMITLPAPDVETLRAEDAARAAATLTKTRRVGLPRKVAIDPAAFGLWETLDGGDRLWRARVRSPGALWLVLGFTTYRLPRGAELYVHGLEDDRVQGPFGADRVRDHAQLWSTPVPGDTAVVELRWDKSLGAPDPNLHLGVVSHGYEPWGPIGADPDPGLDAGACNIDVQCPLGADWQDEKQGVVLTLVNGSRVCTGSMIAIAGGGPCRSLMLTAHHCHGDPSDATSMSLMFNFERPACESGLAPTDDVLGGGGVQRGTWSSSDFTLVEMNDLPPAAFNPYWNGWSRLADPATETWGIHHPQNDEKKICYNADPAVDGSNYGPDHWRVTEWEEGTTEGGSSGSPLFDQDSRIVGQLHGGTASCTSNTWDEYGKLSVSWDGGGTASSRLRDWLDPDGTGAEAIDGSYGPNCGVPAPNLVIAATVEDDSIGNGSGTIDADEPFVWIVDVENRGVLDATGVSGTVTSATPGVEIVDGTATWPDVPTGAVRTSNPPHFEIRTTPSFVCGDEIELTLNLTSAEEPLGWTRIVHVPTGVGTVQTTFADDMESGVSGWTVQSLQGAGPWAQSTAQAASPVTSWFVADPEVVTDQVLVMEPIAAVGSDDELLFEHRINSEGGFDGGVLEYAVDGGAWQDAEPLMLEGGYTSTISTSYSSPIAGRRAWSGDNGAFTLVRVDLSSLAGLTVQFRWRFASDTSVADEGWYVDDVRVESTSYACDPVPIGSVPPSGAGAFTIAPDPGGWLLQWTAPDGPGTAERYVLYRTALGAAYAPECETDLGTGTSAVVPTLPDGHGFLVVPRNTLGEGGYGQDGSGAPREPADEPCP